MNMKICALLFAALALTGCAARQLRADRSLSGETTLVGCLTPGGEPGQYFLVDRNGEKNHTLVAGDPALALHAHHAVRVIGTLNRELPVPGLKAIRVDDLAVSCHTPF